ncbi:type II toxin-antitoxin system VapC family toxin [Segnochrobactrum spirostomi]|uniref:Ribonuclease VapC n=1 Tax=Segnochrobactrum spirostomi TaxID=2608987 RepID=A0A6A7Y8Y3_9HYPH|nr:type II toxin-antitoxin system VapC family toxin [Segnochrobactrum spirostomi]MQT13939.1 type II toxin-antitoxin system VapC family toxin [Segnochrobactrum spirostomi]
MVIDTSAIIAILRAEPEAMVFLDALIDAPIRRLSAASFLEIAIVLGRDPTGAYRAAFDALITSYEIGIEPVTEGQARGAETAYRRFGKGSGSAARLNFGDCFRYALAQAFGEPLLFKGEDFAHTDIRAAQVPR